MTSKINYDVDEGNSVLKSYVINQSDENLLNRSLCMITILDLCHHLSSFTVMAQNVLKSQNQQRLMATPG